MILEINLLVLLTLLEIIFVAMGVGVFLFLRNLSQKRQLEELEFKLANQPAAKVVAQPVPAKSPKPVAQKSYEHYLRVEIDNSSIMLGDSGGLERLDAEPVDENDEEAELRNILAMRHQFLQLELDAQALSKDPEAKRKHMLEGMRALIVALTPEPVQIESEMTDENMRSREQQLNDQIEALRAAVNNQHDVMKELRRLLKEHLGDSAEAQVIIAEIEKAEAEAEKLEVSLSQMTKAGAAIVSGGGTRGAFAAVDAADTDMLKNLVGNQQNTINKLRHMLAEAIPDARAAEQLKQAVDKVQRSNQELGTCVMVLEDENSRLRTEVETLQAKMQDLETAAPPPVDVEPAFEPETEDAADEIIAAELNAEPEQTLDESAEDAVDDIDALLDEVEAEKADDDQPVAESATVDDIDALLDTAAAGESESAVETTTDDETSVAEEAQPVDDPVDDIDALLETTEAGEPESVAEISDEEEVSSTQDESGTVDDIDALLDAVAADTTEEKIASQLASAEKESASVENIEALLDEVAAEPSASDAVASDDEDLDTLLQDVAAASQAEADVEENPSGDDAMDEVDALLAEIAADNKKSGS